MQVISRFLKVRDRAEADTQRNLETLTHPTIKGEAEKRTHLRHGRDQILYQHCDTLQCVTFSVTLKSQLCIFWNELRKKVNKYASRGDFRKKCLHAGVLK